MLSPSTAPRWNKHTSTRRSVPGVGPRANAARARNSGSRPKLTSASAPDRRNAGPETAANESRSIERLLLELEVRAAETEPHGQGAGLRRRQPGHLPPDDFFAVRRHHAREQRAIDAVEQLIRIVRDRH